jgi:hypothetical protein
MRAVRAGVGESLLNVAGHGLVEGARFIVSIKYGRGMTEVTVAGPFDGGLERLEGGCEMLGELAAGVSDS